MFHTVVVAVVPATVVVVAVVAAAVVVAVAVVAWSLPLTASRT